MPDSANAIMLLMKLRFLFPSLLTLSALTGCYSLQTPDMQAYDAYYYRPPASSAAGDSPATESQIPNKGSLKVTFLGTSTLYFDDGETRILIDGFFTRPGNLPQLLFGEIASDRELVKQTLERLNITRLDAIPVFHSHYDHAMDSAEIARLTGARVLGSESTAMIGRGAGLPERQLTVVELGRQYQFGKFTIRFSESKHVPLPGLAESTGMMGDVSKPLYQPASMFAFAEGMTYAIEIHHPEGTSMLHSGAFLPGELKGRKVDNLFLCTPGLPKLSAVEQEQFYREIIQEPGVKRVIPVHWDDFTRPLSEPLVPLPRFAEDLDAAMRFLIDKSQGKPGFEIRFLPTWEAVSLTSL